MIMAGGKVHPPRKVPCAILMMSLVKLSWTAAAVAVQGRAERQNIRASDTNLTLLINQDQKVAGREKGRVHQLGNIFLEEIVRRLHQYGIGMTDARGAQVSWAVFLMIVSIMTGMIEAHSVWTALHVIVLATMIAETAVRTFHLSIDLANSTTGIAHQVV
jgi:Flp pilus assembly protein TadB